MHCIACIWNIKATAAAIEVGRNDRASGSDSCRFPDVQKKLVRSKAIEIHDSCRTSSVRAITEY
jgi:hypothetical protein